MTDIGDEEFYGDCKEDDSKELAENVNESGSKDLFYFVDRFKDNVDKEHVERQRNHYVYGVVFGLKGEQGCERTGPNNKGEYQRNDCEHALRAGIVLEY